MTYKDSLSNGISTISEVIYARYDRVLVVTKAAVNYRIEEERAWPAAIAAAARLSTLLTGLFLTCGS